MDLKKWKSRCRILHEFFIFHYHNENSQLFKIQYPKSKISKILKKIQKKPDGFQFRLEYFESKAPMVP